MKTKLSIAISVALISPLPVWAEHEELPTIVVEGDSMRPGTIGLAPDSSSFHDTAALLKHVPGANVNRNGPLTGIAQYRGMYGNRVNISIDGANMKEVGPNSMDPPLSHIPAPLVESLQVHRGIAPVSSGIETIGGSMKAKSKKGRFADEGEGIVTSGGASMGYSSAADGHYGALLGSVANENHKVYLSGSQEKGRDYKFEGDRKVTPTRYDRNAFTGGYGYQRDGHELGLNYSDNDTGHTGTPALPMDIIYIRGGLYDANYKWDIGDGMKLKSNFYYQNMRHLMNNYMMRSFNPMRGPRENRTDVEGGGFDIDFSMPLFAGDIIFGFNGDQSDHNANITGSMPMMGGMPGMSMPINIDNFNDIERDRYSIFSEWNGKITDDSSLELGVRYTYARTDAGNVSSSMMPHQGLVNRFNSSAHEKHDHNVDLLASYHYNLSSALSFEVGAARKNRAPSYQERYLWLPLEATGGLADGRNYIGNLDLDSETAYQAEFGLEFSDYGVYVAPRIFYHYVNDYIQGLPSTDGLSNGVSPTQVLQFSNIDAQLYGIDIEAGYNINDYWRLDAGLNYVRGQQLNAPTDDDDLYRIAPLNGRLSAVFEGWGWMGLVEGVAYASQGDVAGYNNEQSTAGYMLLNLRGKYEPVNGLVIATGIENVLDKEHYDHLGGYNRVSGNPDVAQGGRIPMVGRNVYATLSYNW